MHILYVHIFIWNCATTLKKPGNGARNDFLRHSLSAMYELCIYQFGHTLLLIFKINPHFPILFFVHLFI